MAQKDNVVKFHRQIHLNIAIIISFIIFIYILFHVFTYLTTENISIYEVKQGTIAAQDNYYALAIRQEALEKSSQEGDIYFFAPSKSRVGVRTILYAIDKKGNIIKQLKSSDNEQSVINLSDMDLGMIENDIQSFMKDYDSKEFTRTYSFKEDLSNNLIQLYNEENLQKNADIIQNALSQNTFFTYYAKTPGLVVYTIDGYENVTLENFSEDQFDPNAVNIQNMRTKETVSSGENLYKVILSDDWNLVMKIDQSMADKLKETKAIEIEFTEDSATTWCTCEILDKAGQKYLILSLDDSMERYAEERFVNINLKLNEQNGLKIPNSSITTKEFYTIPEKYFTKGEDKNDLGLLVQKGSSVEFINTTVYYVDKNRYYIDEDVLAKGDRIQMVNSKETYTVGDDTAELTGVYNVNKGYAVFKQIDILYQNNDYTIVKTGTDYGLSLYDRIVLQGDKVKENDIIN
ncbi:MAG: hypothetical protein K5853_09665 [Lachnospiraceae bacterium]|nr:hypothetical protein [Lachnospiraceae bacterium]